MRSDWDVLLTADEELEARRVANLLASGHARRVESEGLLRRATAAEVESAIGDFGPTLVPLPSNAFDLADVCQHGPAGDEFIVDLPLWTADGRSDLVVRLLLRRQRGRSEISVWDVLAP